VQIQGKSNLNHKSAWKTTRFSMCKIKQTFGRSQHRLVVPVRVIALVWCTMLGGQPSYTRIDMGVQMTKMNLPPSGGADGDRSSPSLLRAGLIFLKAAKHKSEGSGCGGECWWGVGPFYKGRLWMDGLARPLWALCLTGSLFDSSCEKVPYTNNVHCKICLCY
jgi:hypothetical protein